MGTATEAEVDNMVATVREGAGRATGETAGPAGRRSRLASATLVLTLALAAILAGPTDEAQAQFGYPPAGPGGFYPPPSECIQQAFENYLANVSRCKSIYCETWIWMFVVCDEQGFAQCEHNAQQVFDAAVFECKQWSVGG